MKITCRIVADIFDLNTINPLTPFIKNSDLSQTYNYRTPDFKIKYRMEIVTKDESFYEQKVLASREVELDITAGYSLSFGNVSYLFDSKSEEIFCTNLTQTI